MKFHFSFEQIANVLGFLTTISAKGNKQEIIEILSVIGNSDKFHEKKYQELFMNALECFEDDEFKLFKKNKINNYYGISNILNENLFSFLFL